MSHPLCQNLASNSKYPMIFDATRNGLTSGHLSLEAVIIVKTLKGLIACGFIWGIFREVAKFLR